MPEAFYLPLGEGRYEPTRATESPWDSGAQHGGPPTALLAHVIDGTAGADMRLARVSVDFLGPIPRHEVRVEVSPVRPGRLISLSEARMIAGDRTVVVARAWHIATGPPPPVTGERLRPPALSEPGTGPLRPDLAGWGYGRAIEWRYTHGGHGTLGPAGVWTRVRIPLIAGEKITGLARTLIVADSANGLSAVLPMQEWLSIPPTMTATLARVPAGEWVHMAARTRLSDDGLGIAHATLCDPDDHLGEVTQPLLVRKR
ncbi:Thioesterase-like superfamily protein [Thermomonospora echinospora]|uniref:Thioesterase-like superfamily protein n=2 Tax=Thermomonospora echinospora TaxID=1992 RepID=A0A1H6DKG1_9ACTN|nr:Thioesterase-like superfamily protein [Thermomonospora echinospora]